MDARIPAAAPKGPWRRAAGALLLVPAALASVGCDPCDGVVSCTTGPVVQAGGQMIVHETGAPAEGVMLVFTRTGGVPLANPQDTAFTDSDGMYRLRLPAESTGEAVFRVGVVPADERPEYTVEGVRLRAATVRGEGLDLGRWVVDPYIAMVGELHARDGRQLTPGGSVTLLRSSGLELGEEAPRVPVKEAGRFFFLFRPGASGEVRGDLRVNHPRLRAPYRIPDVTLRTRHVDEPIDLDRVFGVGPSLNYMGVAGIRSGTGHIGGPDMVVEFRRTGGIAVEPDTFRVVTEDWGGFSLQMLTFEEGVVEGELILDPPTPWNVDTVQLRLATFNSDEHRLAGTWAWGERIHYRGRVLRRHAGEHVPLEGVEVTFRRTGGIEVDPDSFTVVTEEGGVFPLAVHTEETGVVVGELLVDLPPPLGPQTVQGVAARTFAADGVRYLDTWAFGPQINYEAGIRWADTNEGIGGVEVEFRRTGGISVEPDTFTVRTEEEGEFTLRMHTNELGEVEGELLVHLPEAESPVRIDGVRLVSFEADELRELAWWDVPRPDAL